MFNLVPPFRCKYDGQVAAIIDEHKDQDTYYLYFGTDNGTPITKWVDAANCVAIGEHEQAFVHQDAQEGGST